MLPHGAGTISTPAPHMSEESFVRRMCVHFASRKTRNLERAVEFIHGAIQNDGRVLVHCAAGISRSTTVVLAYLVAKRGMSLRKAFEHTLEARPVYSVSRLILDKDTHCTSMYTYSYK